MKNIGVVRKVDELGRIVIPSELRRVYGINIGDPIEIYLDENQIIFKQYKPKKECVITGDVSDENLTLANGKINLNREAAEILIKELEQYLNN